MAFLPLIQKDDSRLHLKMENRLHNVFVTQLEDYSLYNTETAENVRHVPVITESSSKILDTSVNTLQSTLVLKKQVEVTEVERQLTQERLEFRSRMQALEHRRVALLQKQQETKERAKKFEKFVEENEGKRQRAMKKYQMEKKDKELKEAEGSELSTELKQLKNRHQYLKDLVCKYKKYEEYLMRILDLFPENSLEYGVDSLVIPIIRRHETLSLTQQDLVQRLSRLAEELEQGQHNLDCLKEEHKTSTLMANKELSELQTKWDQIKERNKQLEMNLHMQQGLSRDQVEEAGSLLIAIRNLGQLCHLQHYGPLEGMDMITTMDMIKEFILDKADIRKKALLWADSGSNLTKKSLNGERSGPTQTSHTSSKVMKSNSKSSSESELHSSSKMMQ